MSIGPEPPPLPPRLPRPAQRSGCLTVIMVIAGLIMLLPGLCAIIFGIGAFSGLRLDPAAIGLILFGLFVGFLGIMLLQAATRDPRA